MQIELPARPQSVAVARAHVADQVAIGGEALDAVLLVVSELVTNAVRHAGLRSDQSLTVRAGFRAGRVRIEVVDHGRGFDPVAIAAAAPSPHGGFGLVLVAELSEDWGAQPASGTVWAELAAGAPPTRSATIEGP